MEYFHMTFDVIILIIFLYFLFIKNYFSEKGKNLATKEDIGKITEEIEIVKNEILISTQAKSEFLRERKACLLDFHDKSNLFVDYFTKFVDSLANNLSDIKLIQNEIGNIRLEGAKLVSSFMKLYIYFDNHHILLETAKTYYDSIVKLQRIVMSTLFQIEQSSQNEKFIKEIIGADYITDLNEITKLVKELVENHIIDRTTLLDNEIYKNREQFIIEISNFMKVRD